MRDGQERRTPTDCLEPPPGASVELQLRRSAMADHLDVAPLDAPGMAGAERLHRRLLGREAGGQMNRGHTAASAVRHFPFGENAVQEPIAVTLDRVRDALDIGRVQPESNDGRHAYSSAILCR